MDARRWSEVRRLFEELLEEAPDDPEAFLRQRAEGDTSVVEEVLALVREDAREDTPLDTPPPSLEGLGHDAATVDADGPLRVPQVDVSPYQLLEPLGRGGMGAVFTASRADGAYDRTVALKLVHAGLDSADILRRFQGEQRILASLEHPNIARLYDAGRAGDGRPFLVMEYVDGARIDKYCDDRRLSAHQRIELFLQVCDAVSHAHQGFVIHRDLKPSNILVDADGRVKLLDFGVAKLVAPEADDPDTRTGFRMMTPEYASPEQIRGEVLTAGSDVYALGMVLYELLTGVRPVKGREQAIARALAPQGAPELPRPSDQVSRRPTEVGGRRGPTQRTTRTLRGDLDQILLKALRLEVRERYADVAALAGDLRAYLEGRPVTAQPPSLTYRTRKFVSRRRGGVIGAMLVLIVLVLGVVVSTDQARRATRERDLARAVSSFLEDLFRAPDPRLGLVQDTTRMIDFLAVAEQRVRSGMELRAAPKARLQLVLGTVYRNLSHPDLAIPVLREALATHADAYPGGHPDAIEARRLLGLSLAETGAYEEGVSEIEGALEAQLELEGADAPSTVRLHETLGRAHAGAQRNEEAIPWLEVALRGRRAETPTDPAGLASALNTLGSTLAQAGRGDEAALLLEEGADVLAAAGDVLPEGVRWSDEGYSRNNLAQVLMGLGRPEEARAQADRASVLLDSAFTGPNPAKATNLQRRATLLALAADSAPDLVPMADSLYRASLAMLEALPRSPGGLMFGWNAYGRSLRGWSRLPQGEALLDSAVSAFRRSAVEGERDYGALHPLVMSVRADLGKTLAEAGRPTQALAETTPAYEVISATVPEGHPMLANAALAHAAALNAAGRRAEATTLLESIRPGLVRALSDRHPLVRAVDEALEAERATAGPG